jgi:hypothetical protein
VVSVEEPVPAVHILDEPEVLVALQVVDEPFAGGPVGSCFTCPEGRIRRGYRTLQTRHER